MRFPNKKRVVFVKRVQILQRLKDAGVVAVIRGNSTEEAIKASHAVVKGGMKGIEVTFTVPQADQAISELVEEYRNDPEVVVRGWDRFGCCDGTSCHHGWRRVYRKSKL
jgi:hypothetical protein